MLEHDQVTNSMQTPVLETWKVATIELRFGRQQLNLHGRHSCPHTGFAAERSERIQQIFGMLSLYLLNYAESSGRPPYSGGMHKPDELAASRSHKATPSAKSDALGEPLSGRSSIPAFLD